MNTIIMPSWKSPELLKLSIPSLINSTNSKIIIVLNEIDEESKKIVEENNIVYISRKDNLGPSSVDLALNLVHTKWCCTSKYVSPNTKNLELY